jgi:alpha-glucosidase
MTARPRYRPERGTGRLRGERTASAAGDPACLVRWRPRAQFERVRAPQLRGDVGHDVRWSAPRLRVARTTITQAHLQGYTGASLWREGAALAAAVACPVAPAALRVGGRMTSAWRVVMMADRAGG